MSDDEGDTLSELLRSAGIAEHLISQVYFPEQLGSATEEVAWLVLPKGWGPDSAADVEAVREAVRLGLGLQFTPTSPFDLWWLAEDLKYLRGLWCAGDDKWYQGFDAVAEMEALVELLGPRTNRHVDLSGLSALVSARIRGFGMASAAAAPRLEHFAMEEASRIPRGLRFSASLTSMSLGAKDLAGLDLTCSDGLATLGLTGASVIDLTVAAGLPALSRLAISMTPRVIGTEALTSIPTLRDVMFYRVGVIDSPEILLSLPLDRFEVEGCPSIDAGFAEAAASKPGWWRVTLDRRNASGVAPESLFAVEGPVEGVYELSFDEWGWLADQLGIDDDEFDGMSSWVEDVMIAALRRSDGALLDSGAVEFDAEGEAIHIMFRDPDIATRVGDILRATFANRRRLRAIARATPRSSD